MYPQFPMSIFFCLVEYWILAKCKLGWQLKANNSWLMWSSLSLSLSVSVPHPWQWFYDWQSLQLNNPWKYSQQSPPAPQGRKNLQIQIHSHTLVLNLVNTHSIVCSQLFCHAEEMNYLFANPTSDNSNLNCGTCETFF